ncbi:FAD binding domain-containing protein [Melanomma pulvis-pyrius CBS 109.77]|uniref:FAD binding domain-containing protein n=1 Tax=Melanomma pulvis-pyrius CBS 109.77 TaxID=1314802 RepID=A0A6A6WWU8_9PLEO|nr:FAD binding domain-containing protein [Melanomma pulvis-pyrius CBS 109.77]
MMRWFLCTQLWVTGITALAVRAPSIAGDLSSLVSTASTVSVELRARWSDFNLPLPAVVVNVTSEKDVAAVVKYCANLNIPFLAQNGGNGWGKTFNLGSHGVLINMAGLNAVTFNNAKTQVTIGGGAIIGDTIKAANAAGALVLTGNCNCVGTLGAALGGGYGNLMGEHGFGVDNILSMRVAIATGEVITVSKSSYPDLFWAMRGAGPNFGVVISATFNAWPAPKPVDRTAWVMSLTFEPEKIAEVAQAIQDLPLKPEQNVYLYLVNSGNANNDPILSVTGFLHKGTDESGRAAFASMYALGPSSNSSAVTPYEQWNAAGDGFCARGGRKPAYSTAINNMKAETWPQIWDLYTEFQSKAPNTAVLIERFNLTKAASVPTGSTAFQDALRRDVFAEAIVIPWYTDSALDAEAQVFGQKLRDIWSFSSSPTVNPTYVNFAHGDEELVAIYGSGLKKLRTLKEKWDPSRVFSQWFAIK